MFSLVFPKLSEQRFITKGCSAVANSKESQKVSRKLPVAESFFD